VIRAEFRGDQFRFARAADKADAKIAAAG